VFVRQIHVHGFRNLRSQPIDLSPGINLFVGDNGQGKTNLLEAIHVLAALRSFRTPSLKELVAHGAERAAIDGAVLRDEVPMQLRVVLEKGIRRAWMGSRPVQNVKDYLGQLKAIAFSPDDVSMIKGAPPNRRRFLDHAVFLFCPDHLRTMREFRTSLAARNRLLKESFGRPDRDLIDSFSLTLARAGASVSKARRALFSRLEPSASRFLTELEGRDAEVSLEYQPGWDMGENPTAEALHSALTRRFERDLQRGSTGVGPHLDDFDVRLNGQSARHFASQGQQRSASVALLLAVVEEALRAGSEKPVVLLDDVSSELDSSRRECLFRYVLSLESQVLITTTDPRSVEGVISRVDRRFSVRAGRIEGDGSLC